MYGALLNAAAGLASTGAYHEALLLLDDRNHPRRCAASGHRGRRTTLTRLLMSRLGRHAEAIRIATSTQPLAERIGGPELAAMADAENRPGMHAARRTARASRQVPRAGSGYRNRLHWKAVGAPAARRGADTSRPAHRCRRRTCRRRAGACRARRPPDNAFARWRWCAD